MRSPETRESNSNPEIRYCVDLAPTSPDDELNCVIERAMADTTGDTALFLHVIMLETTGYTDTVSMWQLGQIDPSIVAGIAGDLIALGAIEQDASGEWRATRLGIEAAWQLLP